MSEAISSYTDSSYANFNRPPELEAITKVEIVITYKDGSRVRLVDTPVILAKLFDPRKLKEAELKELDAPHPSASTSGC